MPYQSSGPRRSNVQIGVGRSVWAGKPPPPIPERVLDGIPGCIVWLTLFFCIASAIAFPRILIILATILAIYSCLRFILATYAMFLGNRKIKKQESINWYVQYSRDQNDLKLQWESVHHVVIIPNFDESETLLREVIDNLAQIDEAQSQITIVLAMEASEAGCVPKAEMLQDAYAGQFANFYFTVHPSGLPGEMQCKSANQAWAARWIKRKMVDERDYDINNIVVTTMDADTLWHPNYFSALTYYFVTNPDRYNTFWQAPIRYHSNIWLLNPLLQLVSVYSSAFEIAYLSAPWWRSMPISSYSLSLRLLDISDYWDPDVIADEWHMYIKAFFVNFGYQRLEAIHLPFLARSTSGNNFWQASFNRYSQTLRHAWGSKEVGYIITKMLENPAIPFRPSLYLLLRVSHDILLSGAGWIIVTLGSSLPLMLHQDLRTEFFENPTQVPMFLLFQITLSIMFFVGVIVWYQDIRIRPRLNRKLTVLYIILTILSFFLLPLLTLIFVALPVLHAQTRLLIGASIEFRVSQKL